MLVYRVGHRSKTLRVDGRDFPWGPYAYATAQDYTSDLLDMIFAHSGEGSHLHHPSPMYDPDLHGIRDWEVCGFDSMDALLNWFESWHRTLADNGFRIFVYEVPDHEVRVGAYGQCVFPPSAAEQVAVHDFDLESVQLSLF